MKLNFFNSIITGNGWRCGVITLVFLALAGFGITSTLAQMKSLKRVTSVQLGETAEGSRVSMFSDSALNDYEAFRRGDYFYIKIPLTDFAAAQPDFRGDGFDNVQVQRVGDSILVSFKLQPGATARVDQRSNRLDVIFSSPNRISPSVTANPSRSRITSNAVPGIVMLNNSRIQQKRSPDAAGPMPPDSPGTYRPRVVTEAVSAERRVAGRTQQQSRSQVSSGQEPINQVNTRSTANQTASKPNTSNVDPWKPTLKSDSSSPLTPSPTPSYPAATYVTPASSSSPRPVVTTPPSPAQAGWMKHRALALQWVSANRVAAAIGGIVLLSLIVFASLMIYRRRRKQVRVKRVKMPGVQPKHSTDVDLEEMLDNPTGPKASATHFDEFVSDLEGAANETTLPAATLNASGPANGSRERFPRVPAPPVTESVGNAVPHHQAWVPANLSIPDYPMNNEEREREVFEL